MPEPRANVLVHHDVAHDTLRELADARRIAQLGCWEWDVVTNHVSWSHELYRIYGLEPDERGPSYQAYLSYLHPDDRGFVNDQVSAALRNGHSFDFEHRVIRPSGEVVWVHSRGEVVCEAGAVKMMRGTAHVQLPEWSHDTTAAKRAKQAQSQADAVARPGAEDDGLSRQPGV